MERRAYWAWKVYSDSAEAWTGEGVSGGAKSEDKDTNQGRRPNRTVAEQLRLRRGGGKNAGTSGRAECGMTKNEHRVSKSWGATVGAQTG